MELHMGRRMTSRIPVEETLFLKDYDLLEPTDLELNPSEVVADDDEKSSQDFYNLAWLTFLTFLSVGEA